MTNPVLCAVNESAHGQRALEVAAAFAGGCGVPLILVMVNEGIKGSKRLRYEDIDVKAVLGRAAEAARRAGVEEVRRVIYDGGEAAEAIIETAEKNGVDHIVVGTGSSSAVARFLLGSVSEKVLRNAGCTVTLAR